jgi:hypothetical protein
VKSAHELSSSLGGRTSPLTEEAWNSLWGLKIQAKLKLLLWKVVWDLLPARAIILGGSFFLEDLLFLKEKIMQWKLKKIVE